MIRLTKGCQEVNDKINKRLSESESGWVIIYLIIKVSCKHEYIQIVLYIKLS